MPKRKITIREINEKFFYINESGIHVQVSVESAYIDNKGYTIFKTIYTGEIVHKVPYDPDRGLGRVQGIELEKTERGTRRKHVDEPKKKWFIAGRPAHNHQPNNSARISLAGTGNIDTALIEVDWVKLYFRRLNLTLALKHVNHYLNGSGKTLNVSKNLKELFYQDSNVRNVFSSNIGSSLRGRFFLKQFYYSKLNFKYAFGGIDRVDWEISKDKKTITIWFADRYDYHPVGLGYRKFGGPGDENPRRTNRLHAAMVEMKKYHAKDYWMKGKATFPLSLFKTKSKLPAY